MDKRPEFKATFKAWAAAFAGMTILFAGASCGPNARMKRAHSLESKKKYYEAWKAYQEFAASYPKHKRAAEALFRAGLAAQNGLEDCGVAIHFYDEVLSRYPQADYWAEAAAAQRLNCPDYFPLIPGSRWTEVDSDTKGSIAKTEIECRALDDGRRAMPSQSGVLVRTFYGGRKKFQKTEFTYKKENDKLIEIRGAKDTSPKVLIKWPIQKGTAWRTNESGRILRFEIVDTDVSVRVGGGNFDHCLKIKSVIEGVGGARFEYYAPNVGRVLTTLSSTRGEKRNTELKSYKIADRPVFQKPEEPDE